MLNYINGKGVMNMKQKVILVCSECLSRNYSVTKNKRLNVERLELRKYCKKCGKPVADNQEICDECKAKLGVMILVGSINVDGYGKPLKD